MFARNFTFGLSFVFIRLYVIAATYLDDARSLSIASIRWLFLGFSVSLHLILLIWIVFELSFRVYAHTKLKTFTTKKWFVCK